MAGAENPLDVIREYLEKVAPAIGSWHLIIRVVIGDWLICKETNEDVWIVKVVPRCTV